MSEKEGLYFLPLPRDVQRHIWLKFLCCEEQNIVLHATGRLKRSKEWLETKFARYCAVNGYLALLKWSLIPLEKELMEYAARSGSIPLCKWLRLQNILPTPRVCAFAATNGHLILLDWLLYHGGDVDILCTLNAAANGHLHILEYLEEMELLEGEHTPDACTLAAKHGHLETLIWLRARKFEWAYRTVYEAKEAEQWDCYEWAILHGCPATGHITWL